MMETSMNLAILQNYVNQIFAVVTEFYHDSKKARNRPAFILHYYGHVNMLKVSVYPEGWVYKNKAVHFEIDFNKDFDTNAAALDYILNYIMLLISKWKEESV